jgi:hypothetical protein
VSLAKQAKHWRAKQPELGHSPLLHASILLEVARGHDGVLKGRLFFKDLPVTDVGSDDRRIAHDLGLPLAIDLKYK